MKYKPLPEFYQIGFDKIPEASIVLQAGSNWLTQWGEHKMGFPFEPAFTHAMVYLKNGDLLSMGMTATIQTIDEVYKSSQRFISISYTDMTKDIAEKIIQIGYNRAGSDENKFKLYDFMGYMGFLSRVYPPLAKLKFLKGSGKTEFCSDQVVNVFKEGGYPLYQNQEGNKYTPCDLFMLNLKYSNAFFTEIKKV